MAAMQCVFCVFWQDIDINCSYAMHVFKAGRYHLYRCNACFLWQDSDINGSDAVRALFILQDIDIN